MRITAVCLLSFSRLVLWLDGVGVLLSRFSLYVAFLPVSKFDRPGVRGTLYSVAHLRRVVPGGCATGGIVNSRICSVREEFTVAVDLIFALNCT